MGPYLRMGVIGCGTVALRFHVPALKRCQGVRLAALVDRDRDWAARAAKQHGAGFGCEDYREALGRVDAVLIAVPNHLHRELSCFFLENGVHVLCEKPFAVSAAEAKEMFDCARRGGGRIMAAQNQRFTPGVRFIKEMLEEGLFGDEFLLQMSLGGNISDYRARTDFRTDGNVSGSGVLYDSGIHLIDLAVWLLGDTNPSVASVFLTRNPASRVICEADLVLQSARKSAALACSFTHSLGDFLKVENLHSRASAGFWNSEVSFTSRNSFLSRKYGAVSALFPRLDSYTLQLRHFAQSILHDRPFLVKEEETVAGIQLLEACVKSPEGREV